MVSSIEYWYKREQLLYYKKVKEIVETLSEEWATSILDVGCGPTPIAALGSFKTRHAIDLDDNSKTIPQFVEFIQADWVSYEPNRVYDVITCLQVLEHLPDGVVEPFAQKLIEYSKTTIISVPLMWPKGACKNHIQDPVDEAKMLRWIGKRPNKLWVETEHSGVKRIIHLYENKD